MLKMFTVVEDYVRFRDGNKWKRRYCLLSKSNARKKSITMFITKQYALNIANQDIDEKSLRHYLIDEITGFEYGRHVDKESNVMALIGRNLVYCIGFANTDIMFRWAETLTKLLTTVHFHVTLTKVSDTSGTFSRILVGTQGNLHIQYNRLCLIGEPADGNKFICEWSMDILISVNVYDTICEKNKKVQIKSSGKKHKGNFEFEVSLSQNSIFEDSFQTFLVSCKATNSKFETNFLWKIDLKEFSVDTSSDQNSSISEKVIEIKSSEISIPRSRENSGPDQRYNDNKKIKNRISHKNIRKVANTILKHDEEEFLFADDEEIEDHIYQKNQNLLYSDFSEESSGVFVNSASDCIREAKLSIDTSIPHDSGCDHFRSVQDQSTSSTTHDKEAFSRTRNQETNKFITFFYNISQNPLFLNNYSNYCRLLTAVLKSPKTVIKRSNSFNCIYIPEMKKIEYYRKYSHSNLSFNVTNTAAYKHFKVRKDNITDECRDETFRKVQLQEGLFKSNTWSRNTLLNRLPFKTVADFHCSMRNSLQSGTFCSSLFSYHNFLLLLQDVRIIINAITSKLTPNKAVSEYIYWRNKVYRKNKLYNHWLERMESYNHGVDSASSALSVVDVNVALAFEIIDHLLHSSFILRQGFSDVIPRCKSYFESNHMIKVNNDKLLVSMNRLTPYSTLLKSKSALCSSCSTPDFRNYCPWEQSHKLSINKNLYPNKPSVDSCNMMNHISPSQAAILNNSEPLNIKEGNFKKLRRKYSSNFFIPFIKRKSSTHSTLYEPSCNSSSEDQHSYYNISHQRNTFDKKSLSDVLGDYDYVNIKHNKCIDPSYFPGTTKSMDSNHINVHSSSIDFDDIIYPDEILDPSINYGDLNLIKSKLYFKRGGDTETDYLLGQGNSSLTILNDQSSQNIDTSRSLSFNKQRNYNINHKYSDTFNDRSDYVNVKTRSSPPYSVQSCQFANNFKNVDGYNLNYVSVIENKSKNATQFKTPLSINTQNDYLDIEHEPHQTHDHKRSWLTTSQSSPGVEYCQIDLNCTYALRNIDRMRFSKEKTRTLNLTSSKSASPDDVYSIESLDHIPDDKSLSARFCLEKKVHKHSNRNFLRSMFFKRFGSVKN